ncbi:MAG: cytochrome c3 family protein [Anaeromyxobacteraceae bacterium]
MKSAHRKLVAAMVLLLVAGEARPATRSAAELCTLRTEDRTAATVQACVSCHDGLVTGAHAFVGIGEHPVDVSYDSAAARNLRLLTRFQVSRRIYLPEGKITCVSCHDGASAEPNHTAVSMNRSALCTSCHAL